MALGFKSHIKQMPDVSLFKGKVKLQQVDIHIGAQFLEELRFSSCATGKHRLGLNILKEKKKKKKILL